MNVEITARHCTLPDSVRARAEQRLQRLTRYDARIHGVDLLFENDHGAKRAEARLHVNGGPLMVAHGTGETFQAALDRAADRLTRQLRRRREQLRNHQAAKPEIIEPLLESA